MKESTIKIIIQELERVSAHTHENADAESISKAIRMLWSLSPPPPQGRADDDLVVEFEKLVTEIADFLDDAEHFDLADENEAVDVTSANKALDRMREIFAALASQTHPADGVREALDAALYAIGWVAADSWDHCAECRRRLEWAGRHLEAARGGTLTDNDMAQVGQRFASLHSPAQSGNEERS